ncbi:MAG: type I-C CRISPR-associated protein Cas8c/Csd1, partial [Armatimonadetes bacterium]|nr:type I-C CRISPR-associated protein Cas8c/Csd1 [Armatimonadota bacterium]
LVSFDEESFASGSLEQSANYAVSEETAWAYAAALNHLLDRGVFLVNAKVAYWFKNEIRPEDDPVALMSEEQIESDALKRARELLTAIREGKRPDLADNLYFAVTLSGNAGRAVVRDWMHGSFEQLASNVDAWFTDLSVLPPVSNREARSPKFTDDVLGALLRPNQKPGDLPAPFVTRLWRAAMQNEPIPRSALSAALARVKAAVLADDPVRHEAIGLIKAYHIRKARVSRKEGGAVPEDFKPRLNPDHPEPAYHCGRLMAVYAQLQRTALGDVGAGVVQRYYAAASATPALVLGRLARLSTAHLGKLDPGLARWYEQLLAEIWGRMGEAVPRVLDLEGQSLFALGYYQQLADLRTKKAEVGVEQPESADAGASERPGAEA